MAFLARRAQCSAFHQNSAAFFIDLEFSSVRPALSEQFCSHYKITTRRPLRVKSGREVPNTRCPIFPRKQTPGRWAGMSVKCHNRTYAVQQTVPLRYGLHDATLPCAPSRGASRSQRDFLVAISRSCPARRGRGALAEEPIGPALSEPLGPSTTASTLAPVQVPVVRVDGAGAIDV
jgi:hypothetical protein